MKIIRWSPRISAWHAASSADSKNKRLTQIISVAVISAGGLVAFGYWNIASTVERLSKESYVVEERETQTREKAYQERKQEAERAKNFRASETINFLLKQNPKRLALEYSTEHDMLGGVELHPVCDKDLLVIQDANELEVVDLCGAHISNRGLHVFSGKKLRELYLSNCPISSLTPFAGMTSLIKLGLSKTRITDSAVKMISTFKNLTSLDLNSTDITDACLPSLYALSAMTELDLLGCKHVTIGAVKQLEKKLPNCGFATVATAVALIARCRDRAALQPNV